MQSLDSTSNLKNKLIVLAKMCTVAKKTLSTDDVATCRINVNSIRRWINGKASCLPVATIVVAKLQRS
jgi:hypothetical protein